MAMTRNPWVLSLEDGFTLCDGDGCPVKFPYRKVEELFVALFRAGKNGVSRDIVAHQLWPSSSIEVRRTNFRQILSHLKKSIGDDNLVVDRLRCRLSTDFAVRTSDLEVPFSPFDSKAVTPSEGFKVLIKWLSENDPNQMFDLLKSNVDLVTTLQLSDLSQAMVSATSRLPIASPHMPWATFWRGLALMLNKCVVDARPLFRESVRHALASEDFLLLREAAFRWGLCEVLLGRPEKAIELADQTSSLIAKSGAKSSYKLQDLRGTALIHLGRKKEALDLFECLTDFNNVTAADQAFHEALRALYLATSGNFSKALEVNEYPSRFANESGAIGLLAVCDLTKGYILANDEPSNAMEHLDHLISVSNSHGLRHIGLYAREALALAYRNQNLLGEANSMLKSTNQMRHGLGFHYTHWDQSRLKRLAHVS